jgi:hypothetical protein
MSLGSAADPTATIGANTQPGGLNGGVRRVGYHVRTDEAVAAPPRASTVRGRANATSNGSGSIVRRVDDSMRLSIFPDDVTDRDCLPVAQRRTKAIKPDWVAFVLISFADCARGTGVGRSVPRRDAYPCPLVSG